MKTPSKPCRELKNLFGLGNDKGPQTSVNAIDDLRPVENLPLVAHISHSTFLTRKFHDYLIAIDLHDVTMGLTNYGNRPAIRTVAG